MRKFIAIGILIFCFLTACQSNSKKVVSHQESKDISKVIAEMTEIMVHDITNPPLAARFFSYSLLAGYEIVAQNNDSFPSLKDRLNGFPEIKADKPSGAYNYQLSALLAVIKTAEKLQPSGPLLKSFENDLLDSLRTTGVSEEVLKNSELYAANVSQQILKYAKEDGYVDISNYPRYEPSGKPGSWYPTPPAFISAVEPYFNTLRSFTLDSANQFKPEPPASFSINPQSDFHKLMTQNYKDSLTEEHIAIASFWDCNPFVVDNLGHMMTGVKKISPGAHWLGIAGIACETSNKGFDEAMQIHTVVSIGLMDAFMVCWDEKYRSDRIRPETAIRSLLDPHWQPLLQTPPFPEYPSGHSTISASSAHILTYFFGDHFSFDDTIEVPYGLPVRSFTSFNQARDEAAMSRFYGGIHFMDAIDDGLVQGKSVGDWVIKKFYGSEASQTAVAQSTVN